MRRAGAGRRVHEEEILSPTSIFEKMRGDHERVLVEIAGLERAATTLEAGGAARGDLERALVATVGLLQRQFATHMAAEDEVLFPALARALPEALGRIEPLQLEHEELRSMLDSLVHLLATPEGPERNEQLAVEVHDLVDLLRIHIRKEEAVVFRVAEQVLEPRQLEALAERMAAGAGDPSHRAPRGPSKGNAS